MKKIAIVIMIMLLISSIPVMGVAHKENSAITNNTIDTDIALINTDMYNNTKNQKFTEPDFITQKRKESNLYVPGEIIIQFRNVPTITGRTTDITGINNIATRNSILEINKIFDVQKRQARADTSEINKFYKFKFSNDTCIYPIIEKLIALDEVITATPNYIPILYNIPNDPYYNSYGTWGQEYLDMYGLHNTKMADAWNYTTGDNNIIVAVLDTGVDYNHPDIIDNIWINEDEIPANNIDDDNDGFIDNIHGADFSDNDGDPIDSDGHGTHCAGTIGATGNNTLGIVGMCWNISIMPVKIFPFMTSSSIADAIRWAVDNGADVLSNSWGFSFPILTEPTIESAVRYAYDAGSIIVFAAGNGYSNVEGFPPQNMDETITVAAVNHQDIKPAFSNYGELIDVCAPGVDILSLMADNVFDDDWVVGENYYRISGTSMACPHVAGLIAYLLSTLPDLSNEDIDLILSKTSDNIDDINKPRFKGLLGSGRINGKNAMIMEHNVMLTSLKVPIKHLQNTDTINISTSIFNYGINSETINLTLKIDNNIVETKTISLDSITTENIIFEWTPSIYGNHTITMNASILHDGSPENNELSNYVTFGVHNKNTNQCFATIQEAIDSSSDGDLLIVPIGFYNENIYMNKNISLIGNNTYITGSDSSSDVVTITQSNFVTISNFILSNGNNGIFSTSSNNLTINDNDIRDTECGIMLSSTSNTAIYNNNISENYQGISTDINSFNIKTHHNNFDNIINAEDLSGCNRWDNGYIGENSLQGGNWWADYQGIDIYSGPEQILPSTDGIGDTPYNISGDGSIQDNYPLIVPFTGTLPKNIYVDDDNTQGPWLGDTQYPYRTITDAINISGNHDTVFVFNGTYHECVVVDKPISLIGENPNSTTIIFKWNDDLWNYYYKDRASVRIHADNVVIRNFTIKSYVGEGIFIDNYVSNVNIFNNYIHNNIVGILVMDVGSNYNISFNKFFSNDYEPVFFLGSHEDIIFSNNIITGNKGCIEFFSSKNTIIKNNTIINKYGFPAISCRCCTNMTIINNSCYNCSITIGGVDYIKHWNTHTLENNTNNGIPIRYYKNINNFAVPTNTSQVILVNCSNVTIKNITSINNVWSHIDIAFCSFINISENTLSFAKRDSIFFESSNNNTITNNILQGDYITLFETMNTTITDNIIKCTIRLQFGSNNNTISKNLISYKGGIYSSTSSNNFITENKFMLGEYRLICKCCNIGNHFNHNDFVAKNDVRFVSYDNNDDNIWNNNYYSDYIYDYPHAEEIDDSGIWNTPYNLYDDIFDDYPMVEPQIMYCSFDLLDIQYIVGDTIDFAPSVKAGIFPYTYEWDFGDGTLSNQVSPSHIYAEKGAYPVTLKVTDSTGNTCTNCVIIQIKDIDIRIEKENMLYFVFPVNLTAYTRGITNPCNYTWYITENKYVDDGITLYGKSINHSFPFFGYNKKQYFSVILTVKDENGSVYTYEENLLIIYYKPHPRILSSDIGVVGITMHFSSRITGGIPPYTYEWYIDNSYFIYSTDADINYTFYESGEHRIILSVEDVNGISWCDNKYVTIIENEPLTVSTNGPYESVVSKNINFECYVTGGVPENSIGGNIIYSSYHWDFGDGGVLCAQNGIYTYMQEGNYTVTLTVTDSIGQTSQCTTTSNITFIASAQGCHLYSINHNEYQTLPNVSTEFRGVALGGDWPYTYEWDFDNDSVVDSTEQYSSYSYDIGTYTAVLKVTDSTGDISIDSVPVYVSDNPSTQISTDSPYYGTTNQEIQINASVRYGTACIFMWEHPLSTSPPNQQGNQNITHIFTEPFEGYHFLLVFDTDGNLTMTKVYFIINQSEPDSVTANAHGPYYGFIGETIHLHGDASGGVPPYTFMWSNPVTEHQQDTTCEFDEIGTYDMFLIAIDAEGNTSSDYFSVYISIKGDLDGDNDIDNDDFLIFTLSFGSNTGDLNYNSVCDYDNDGSITFIDYQIWLQCYRDYIQ